MAKDINKYAQNIARARYARQPYMGPQRRATIDPTLFTGKKAAAGAPLASRPIEGGPALPSPQEYNPIIDAESGEDPNAPRVETQQPIENRGSSARYMLQTGGPRLDLSFLVPERANPNYDPNKAIGGENVPYLESKGIGGFFRRMLGDESNRMNIEAQQAQGAEWRAEAKAEKERQGRMEDYRTQRMIDKEIDDARDDKRNAQAIAMFDKSKAAQLEVLKLQNDYAKANTAEEQKNILARMGVAHNNAMALQDRALAASEKNLGLQQNFQARLANFNAQMQGWQDANRITNMGDGFFARGGEVYGLTKGTPDIGNIKGTPPEVTPTLLGPRGEGAQVPQMDVDGAAPSMGAVTPARSALPPMLPPGDGVRLPSAASEAVTSSYGDDVYRQNVITPPRAKATRTTPEKPPAEVPKPTAAKMPKPTAATPPDTSEETGEEVQGLIPAIGEPIGEWLSSGEFPSLAQEAPATAESRKGFMTALGDVGRGLSEGARSVKPLLMGGKLPRYSQDQGGNALGMLLNAPGAILSPVEYGINTVFRNPIRAGQGVDPSTSQPVRTKLQDPNTMYMSDAEYKNYLRRQKLNNY